MCGHVGERLPDLLSRIAKRRAMTKESLFKQGDVCGAPQTFSSNVRRAYCRVLGFFSPISVFLSESKPCGVNMWG